MTYMEGFGSHRRGISRFRRLRASPLSASRGLLLLRDGRAYRVPISGLGFSLKPSKKIRRAFRKIKKAVTLKRALKAGLIVGGAVYGGPLLLKGGGLLARKAGGLIRGRFGKRTTRPETPQVPGIEVSAPMTEPAEYAPTPSPEVAPPGGGGGGGEYGEAAEAEPAAAGAGRPGFGIPAPLLIGGLVLATVMLGRAAGAARSRR